MSDTENTNAEPRTRSRTSGQASSRTDTPNSTVRGWDAVTEHISGHKVDFIMALTRALTVLCTISYIIGIPGPASNRFKQALLMTAATSSLRLHQRMPPPPLSQINRDYFMTLIREDSFHYLTFPFMFLTGQPITLTLLPCILYAIFNLAVYAITILDKFGNQDRLKSEISNLITRYQQNLLHTIALSELALMPIIVVGVMTGAVSIFVPVLYYRFLKSRYNSARNAHLKLMVQQVKTIALSYYTRYRSR